MTNISNSDDIIDSRDIIARIEELEAERDSHVLGAPDGSETPDPEGWAGDNPEDSDELDALYALAKEGADYAADWQHGETLIRDSYFRHYAQELAEDIGAIQANAPWPVYCIDWDQAARDLKMDYGAVDFAGVTYWVR